MAKKARTKIEFFSARFDPQTSFALNLVAKQRGQKKANVVEQAILDLAKKIAEKELGQALTNLFHPHDGVRTLNLLACPGYKRTSDDEDLRAFILAHKEFFYSDAAASIPNVGLVITLWDDIDKYRELWREKRHENYWVAAEAMEARLKKAKIKPPKYGQEK